MFTKGVRFPRVPESVLVCSEIALGEMPHSYEQLNTATPGPLPRAANRGGSLASRPRFLIPTYPQTHFKNKAKYFDYTMASNSELTAKALQTDAETYQISRRI